MALQLSFEFADQAQPGPPPVAEPSAAIEDAYAAASRWSLELAERLGERVRLVVTDNRRIVLSAQRKSGRMEVRMHHMFLSPGAEMFEHVARYLLRGDRRSSKKIDDFVETQREKLARSTKRGVQLNPVGKHHDLAELLRALSLRYLGREADVDITWGRRVGPKRGQRSIQLGNYTPDDKLIRIHPALDQDWVPQFFVEAVIYHELLHHEMPAVVSKGRHNYHTAAFREAEARFEFHEQAERWEKDNFWRLLRRR